MKKKWKFALSIGILSIFVVLVGTYFILIKQISDNRAEKIVKHYFGKTFQEYQIEVGELDYSFSRQLVYKLKNVQVKKIKPTFKSNLKLLNINQILVKIPYLSIFGSRNIEIDLSGSSLNLLKLDDFFLKKKNPNSFKIYYPTIFRINNVNIRINNLEVRDLKSNEVSLEKILIRDLKTEGYSTIEIVKDIDLHNELGRVVIVGEIKIKDIIEEKFNDYKLFLKLEGFKENENFNAFRFKINPFETESYLSTKLLLVNEDKQSGGLELYLDEGGVKLSNINLTLPLYNELNKVLPFVKEKKASYQVNGEVYFGFDNKYLKENLRWSSSENEGVEFLRETGDKYSVKYDSEELKIELSYIIENKELKLSKISFDGMLEGIKILINIFNDNKEKLTSFANEKEDTILEGFFSIGEKATMSFNGILNKEKIALSRLVVKNNKKILLNSKLLASLVGDKRVSFESDLKRFPVELLEVNWLREKVLSGRLSGKYLYDSNEDVGHVLDLNLNKGKLHLENWNKIFDSKIEKIKYAKKKLVWSSEFDRAKILGKFGRNNKKLNIDLYKRGLVGKRILLVKNEDNTIKADVFYIKQSKKLKNILIKHFNKPYLEFDLVYENGKVDLKK